MAKSFDSLSRTEIGIIEKYLAYDEDKDSGGHGLNRIRPGLSEIAGSSEISEINRYVSEYQEFVEKKRAQNQSSTKRAEDETSELIETLQRSETLEAIEKSLARAREAKDPPKYIAFLEKLRSYNLDHTQHSPQTPAQTGH